MKRIFALLPFLLLGTAFGQPAYTFSGALPGKTLYVAPTNFFWGDLARYCMVIDGNDGSLKGYLELNGMDCESPGPFCNNIFGFRPLSSGNFAYVQWDIPSGNVFRISDSTFTLLDTFSLPEQDNHEFYIEDGNIYLISRYDTLLDMSAYTFPFGTGSSSQNCEMMKAVILDSSSKEVIGEWDAGDLPLNEFDVSYSNDPARVSPIHMNSFVPIHGIPGWKYVASLRNRNSVVILGEEGLIYELGGLGSDFTFVNDTSALGAFSGQHDAQIFVEEDNIILTLYDNGNKNSPPASRGVKYRLDTTGMTAELIESYTHPFGTIYANSQGSFRAFPEGGGLVNWGGLGPTWSGPIMTAFDSLGNVIMEMQMDSIGFASYRAYFVDEEIMTGQHAEPEPPNPIITQPTIQYYDFQTLRRLSPLNGRTICEQIGRNRLYIEVEEGQGKLKRCVE